MIAVAESPLASASFPFSKVASKAQWFSHAGQNTDSALETQTGNSEGKYHATGAISRNSTPCPIPSACRMASPMAGTSSADAPCTSSIVSWAPAPRTTNIATRAATAAGAGIAFANLLVVAALMVGCTPLFDKTCAGHGRWNPRERISVQKLALKQRGRTSAKGTLQRVERASRSLSHSRVSFCRDGPKPCNESRQAPHFPLKLCGT